MRFGLLSLRRRKLAGLTVDGFLHSLLYGPWRLYPVIKITALTAGRTGWHP
jgi:hypothetical protein